MSKDDLIVLVESSDQFTVITDVFFVKDDLRSIREIKNKYEGGFINSFKLYFFKIGRSVSNLNYLKDSLTNELSGQDDIVEWIEKNKTYLVKR